MKLDDRQKSLIAVAAAVASNCTPCFRWHTKHCLDLGVSKQALKETIELAEIIKGTPTKLFNDNMRKIAEKYGINN